MFFLWRTESGKIQNKIQKSIRIFFHLSLIIHKLWYIGDELVVSSGNRYHTLRVPWVRVLKVSETRSERVRTLFVAKDESEFPSLSGNAFSNAFFKGITVTSDSWRKDTNDVEILLLHILRKQKCFSPRSWKTFLLRQLHFSVFFFFFAPSLLCSELVFCQKQQGELAGDPNPERREPVDPVVHRLAEG